MISTENGRALSDFSRDPTETFDRLDATGQAEFLTVDGLARAVLLSPEMYKQLMLAADVSVMRRAIQDGREGKGQDAAEFFAELRAELLAMKTARSAGASE